MNRQALNPLRWATAAKHGAGTLWEKRPRLTKRRVAWGLAVSMLAGGGGLYGYQKLGPGKRPATAASTKTAQDQPLQPIPDTATADSNSPNAAPADPNAAAAYAAEPNAGDPNANNNGYVDPNSVDPNSVDPNAVAPNAIDPNTVPAVVVDPNAGDPNAGDPNMVAAQVVDPNAADPNAGNPNAGDPNSSDPNSSDPNAGGAMVGDANTVAVNERGGQPTVYAEGESETAAGAPVGPGSQPPPSNSTDTLADAPGNADASTPSTTTPLGTSGGNARSRNSLRTGLAADEPTSESPVATTPPVPATAPIQPAPADSAPVDLVPVPRRPQPSPPEEHVRLPPEAAPNLSPDGALTNSSLGNSPGNAPGNSPSNSPGNSPGNVSGTLNAIGNAGSAVGGGLGGTVGGTLSGAAAGAVGGAAANAAPNSAGPGLPQFRGGSPSMMAPPPAPPYTPPTPINPIAGNPGSTNQNFSNPTVGSAASSSVLGDGGAEPGVLPDMGGVPIVASPMPGAKSLEGPQVPMLELQKLAPEEVKVGKPARFEIKVKNIGRVAAQHIVVIDQIPRGTKFLEAAPPCLRGVDGVLRWQVGALGPGQETTIVLQLLPEQEGEIGSVAQVIFHSQAAVRTVSTQPRVTVEHQVAERVLIGDQVKLTLAVANRGSGATSNLVLEATLPESLGHPAGAELEYPIGVLRPNETRRIELSLRAQRPGAAACQFVAREESQTLAEDRVSLDILAPQLQVGVAGPKVRYLDRQATYSVSVANPGTAAATNLEVIAYLPRGLKFLSAENQGQYDPQRHAVLWGLAELPSGVMGASQLVVVPAEPGEQRIRVEGKADLRLEHAFEQPVLVETLSEIQFSVVDTADPIEVGSETTYEIKLQNRGSRAASQVRVAVEFPAELTPSGGDGPTAVAVRGQQLLIDPVARLAPNAQATYRIRARGAAKGDPRIRVLVASDESPTPVTKEESTRVYSDE
jgi:uncharacterized repeat protein (TIGR01451 family)